jgi:hypothetical protein
MTRVEIVIDELVLRGVSRSEAEATARALESRLTALAERSGGTLPARSESSRRLDPVTAAPDRLGDAVADAVWGAIA